MNMELDDLPPRYRAQAEQQLAARKRRAADPLTEAVKQAKAAGRDFDSRGEYEFYTGIVLPKMARGEIVECEQHPAFPLFPAGEYCTMKLRPIRYTADFRLKYADGTVEIVEIKSKFVRRMSASSAAWKAISAATGELVAPDGNGTTQGTVKLDFISGKWIYSTTIAHTTGANGCSFKDVTCDSSIGAAAKLLLQALAMLPDAALTGDGIDATYGGDYFYINNAEAERCLIRGGYWNYGGSAGVFYSSLNNPRSDARGSIGGRSAFYE